MNIRILNQALKQLLVVGCVAAFAAANASATVPEPVVSVSCTPTPTPLPVVEPTCPPTPVTSPIVIETPTETPTEVPSETPTEVPTETPIETPTETPTESPTVSPTLEPLSCPLTAVPDTLWPPNHRYVQIAFEDASGSPVTPLVTGVTQDEPTLIVGSGNFCPDARINEDGTVSVRAERSGLLDGRVYHIAYQVETGNGPCEGVVTVCVPHDQGQGSECVDQGGNYNSLTCNTADSLVNGDSQNEAARKGKKGKKKARKNRNAKK